MGFGQRIILAYCSQIPKSLHQIMAMREGQETQQSNTTLEPDGMGSSAGSVTYQLCDLRQVRCYLLPQKGHERIKSDNSLICLE